MTKTAQDTVSKCDWCGSHPIKIHRRYKDEAYCVNCYKTWFIKKPCSLCYEISRLHKKEEQPICQECCRKQPCIRCGRDAYTDGANTQYGRVCQTCYQGYFKEKRSCEMCGERKTNISRYSDLPHDLKICTTCYQRQTHQSCSACKRFRKLIETPKGQLCQKCHELGEVNCSYCNQKMPAGLGSKCWNCYWSQRLEKEVKVTLYLFESEKIKQSFKSFIEWLVKYVGINHATIRYHKFIDFFVTCDDLWQKIPSYDSLVQEFKPEGLRHHLTVLRWLVDTTQIVIDLKIKSEIAEEERISNLLGKFEELPKPIQRYYEFLNQKLALKKTSLQSIRLALQPVVGLYLQFNLQGQQKPSQAQLDGYLKEKHGQFNALYGFVSFINKQYALKLKLSKPSTDTIKKIRRKQLEKELIKLNQASNLTSKDQQRWLSIGLEYFHGLKVSSKVASSLKTDVREDRIVVHYHDYDYVLPL